MRSCQIVQFSRLTSGRGFYAFAFSLLVFGGLLFPIAWIGPLRASDFPAYYVTAKQIVSGHSADVYVLDRQAAAAKDLFSEGCIYPFDPPYVLAETVPLIASSPEIGRRVVGSLLVLLLATGTFILGSALELSTRRRIVLVVSTAMSGPAFETVKVCKPIPLFYVGLCATLWLLRRGRLRRAAVCTALCVMKPHEILPFTAFALGNKRFIFVTIVATLGLLWLAITFPVFGSDGYRAYARALDYVSEHPEIVGVATMPTLKGQLLRLSVAPGLANTLSSAFYIVTVMVVGALGFVYRTKEKWWIAGTILGFTVGIVGLPYMHLYDLVIAIPAVCLLMTNLGGPGRRTERWVAYACVASFIQPIYTLVHYDYLLGGGHVVNVHFVALCVLAVIAVVTTLRSGSDLAIAS